MSDTVIKVENLSKKYVIGHQRQVGHTNFRDVLADGVKNVGRKLLYPFNSSTGQQFNGSSEEFYALKDVSFEIKRGDRVGIIGRNGAGKSTLLKILSRIVEPTSGRIEIDGRVASLLEVGTGFHPELTGRENIFLNGAILGMTRAEILCKFDEIVDFSELEKFLDTPVKRYSSGMYVRLAFAVAAHLEPEILIVDEVLAVGDAQFQKKCLGKMRETGWEGRTVLFVSHNMSAVEALCRRGLVLKGGCVTLDANAREAVTCYLDDGRMLAREVPLEERSDRQGSGRTVFVGLNIYDKNGRLCENLKSGEDYIFCLSCNNTSGLVIDNVIISIDMLDDKDNYVMLLRSNFENKFFRMLPGINQIKCHVKNMPYVNGSYIISLFMSRGDVEILDYVSCARNLQIEGGNYFPNGSNGLPTHCKFLLNSQWHQAG